MALFNNSSTLPPNALVAFLENTKVTDASRVIFPTVTSNYCYASMFSGCRSLVNAPALPATTLADSCYADMFYNCDALVNAPAILPATTLTRNCYASMFWLCLSLVTAPVISAITMAYGSCDYMFYGCSSLITIPGIVATTMLNYSCRGMFQGCSLLKFSQTQRTECPNKYRIPTKGTGTVSTPQALQDMFLYTSGTFTGTPSINTTYYTNATVV